MISLTLTAQTVDVYGPQNFNEISNNSFNESWTPTAVSSVENLQYLVFLDQSSQSTAVMLDGSDPSKLKVNSTDDINGGSATYGSMLRSIFQVVDVNTDASTILLGQYRIHPVLYSYHALNADNNLSGSEVIVTDADSYYIDEVDSNGYIVVEFIGSPSSVKVLVSSRYYLNPTTNNVVELTSWTDKYLKIDGSALSFVTNEVEGSSFFLADASELIDFEIAEGSDFNPMSTTWQTNEFAAYPNDVWAIEGSQFFDTQFTNDVDDVYEDQFGTSSEATAIATAMLDAIENTLTAEGASLRYEKSIYLEFRENLLARTLASTDVYNGRIGENTVPYVYFTNATDDDGIYHPFMVIASHNISDGPNFLIDVARPPGDGLSGGYEDQTVTRNCVLEHKLVKIPLKDYGLISILEDNDLSSYGTLAEDMGVGSNDYDVYNYASTESSGIAVDGVVIYPAYNNNNLRFAAEDAEITNTGIHVGRGMGLHYHADGHSFNGNGLNLYNISDYEGNNHPPLIGFGYDGVALFGKYESSYSSMLGYSVALDEYGGHEHDDLGYHYHSFKESYTANGSGTFEQHFLLAGAWKGDVNEIPGLLEASTAQLKDATAGRFAGASYTPVVTSLESEAKGLVSVTLYPNPSIGSFKVEVANVNKLTLIDISGMVVEEREVKGNETAHFSGLAHGVYLLNAYGTDSFYSLKFTVE